MYKNRNSPSVAVACREAHEAVGKVVVADKAAELASEVGGVTHGTIPVADNGLRNQGSEVVIILPADTLNSKSNVGRRNRIITKSDFGSNKFRSLLLCSNEAGGLAGEMTKVLLTQLDELLVRDTTSTDQNHTVSSVVGLDVVNQVVAGDGLDVLLGAEDCAAKRLVLESGSMQVVKDNLFELLVNLLLLTQDHISLPLDGSGLQFGVLKDVGEDVDSLGNIGIERLGIVNGVLPLYLN